jgi:hypothetical protein
MSSQPSNFRRTDVKRAVQAIEAAGRKIARVELHGGKVLIIPAGDDEVADDSNNSFDRGIVYVLHGRAHPPSRQHIK